MGDGTAAGRDVSLQSLLDALRHAADALRRRAQSPL